MLLRRFFSSVKGDVKEIIFDIPPNYRRLGVKELYFVNATEVNKTFLRSHQDVRHEYFVSEQKSDASTFKTFYIKSYFGRTCEGPPMHAHGGLTAALLDEAMGTSCWCNHIGVMTKEFTTKYHVPVKLNEEIHGVAYIKEISEDGYHIKTYGKLFYPDDEQRVLVETNGIFKKLSDKQLLRMQTWSKNSRHLHLNSS